MKLHIKQLKGETLEIEIHEKNNILELKNKISQTMEIPVSQLTLLHVGKTLKDENQIDFYSNIQDGSKINLVIKKPESLRDAVMRFLLKYVSREQAVKITDSFMKDFNEKRDNLSLDDIERIASSWENEEQL